MKAFVSFIFFTLLIAFAAAEDLSDGGIAGIVVGSTAAVTLSVTMAICLACCCLVFGVCCGSLITAAIAGLLCFLFPRLKKKGAFAKVQARIQAVKDRNKSDDDSSSSDDEEVVCKDGEKA